MYIYQKTIQRDVNGESVDCMSLNIIADPTCNQVDNVEPDITCWREPAYGTVASKVYVHIKGDTLVTGDPAYLTGDVTEYYFPTCLMEDDVNGVRIVEDGSEGLHIYFTEHSIIDESFTTPDGDTYSTMGHIYMYTSVYNGYKYVGMYIGGSFYSQWLDVVPDGMELPTANTGR